MEGGKYELELSPEKTRVIPFSRKDRSGRNSFDFLGLEFYWGNDREGKEHLKRRTSRKKPRNSHEFTNWWRKHRNLRSSLLFKKLNLKLRRYYNYYAIKVNSIGVGEFTTKRYESLLKWLNRRSQRRSLNRQGFNELMDRFNVQRPRIGCRPAKKTMTASTA